MDVTNLAPLDFTEWFAKNRAQLSRLAYLLSHDRGQADDVLQEALAKLHQRWAKVSERGDPSAYARRTMINQLVSWHRKQRFSIVPLTLDVSTADPNDALVDQNHLWAVLQRLPPRQRAAVVLRYYEDRDDPEIARLLGCSPATVRSHISKGLASMRQNLSTEEQQQARMERSR